MAIQFVIDSASDFDHQEAQALGLCFLPLTIEWEGKVYRDQLDISSREFYEKLVETDALPTTAQLSPNDYSEAFAGSRQMETPSSSSLCPQSCPAPAKAP